MQQVSSAFTAEEIDNTRSIANSLLISWKKESTLGAITFTVGVSVIGSNDVIGINPGVIGSPGNYKYFDETSYLLSLGYERSLSLPTGGMTKAFAEAVLDNTSNRFTPRYSGGNSELFTAILPRRPFIISGGFDFEGIDQVIPQFSGVLNRQPNVSARNKTVSLIGEDYIGYFENKYLDHESMFTGLRTDEVMENMLLNMGLSTSQYDLDIGLNLIPFGLFEKGTKYDQIFNELAESENGQFYQDEEGKFRFNNRQHWTQSPYDEVSRIIYTAQVIEDEIPDEDHIINVVEINSSPRSKQPNQILFRLALPVEILSSEVLEMFINFDDPVLEITGQEFIAFENEDSSGSQITVTQVSVDKFAKAAKYRLSVPTSGYLTQMTVYGRPAKVSKDIYYRAQDDSSVTAFEERPYRIENDYIQSESWANSYAQMILNDFSDPENIKTIHIRAMPSLQLGDLISWQGRHWRIFGIKGYMSQSDGYLQDLNIVQSNTVKYFTIGVSLIGETDKIAP